MRYYSMKNTVDSLVFATNNAHKLAELRAIVDGRYNILSLSDIDCHEDIPETAPTLQGNAEQKARYIKEHYGYDCFADDTGLMVDALDGEPGCIRLVMPARSRFKGQYGTAAAQYGA